MGIKHKLSSMMFKNLLTSGMTDIQNIDILRKVILINTISTTGVIFMVLLGIIAFLQGNSTLGHIDLLVSILLLSNLMLLRHSRNHQAACIFGIVMTGLLYLYLLVTGGVNNTAHVWYYTFPLAASFLLGAKRGAFASMLLLAMAVIFFLMDFNSPFFTHYSNDFIIRFIPSFIVVFIFSFAFEYFRERANVQLIYIHDELNRTIEELKTTDSRLRKAQEELENRVEERTAELSRINIDLKQEIKERERAVNEQRRLEIQLTNSQKMEAIGTLAGGVAHDLNNILSASVSIPDLILMDMQEDNPLREPLLLIRKSGEKAASIVNDLLNLARRGLVHTEITNLNQVINSYFESPEFEKLKEFHPGVSIESCLDPDLLNLMGSPVHLSKVVMNLVRNAAEAIDTVGKIFISTENRYIDEPVYGYDTIRAGNYIVLIVADNGEGIREIDMERLFEPFFTRKKLGRSGTGLGMTVLWGTVKDHKGYIDAKSVEGKGATFSVFLPVTSVEISEEEKDFKIEEYLGSGETVLVIDDSEDQRRIASKILTRLGYSVAAVSGGEDAVDYLTENRADVLILDMIMNPGIDGLETYKRILDLHPGQKAIIASGFSETDRVKEVLRIGAGAYIRKPYSLKEIGTILRTELGR